MGKLSFIHIGKQRGFSELFAKKLKLGNKYFPTIKKASRKAERGFMSKKELTEEARQARNAYMKRWRAENKDKVAEYNAKFWQRKSDELKGLGENDQNN